MKSLVSVWTLAAAAAPLLSSKNAVTAFSLRKRLRITKRQSFGTSPMVQYIPVSTTKQKMTSSSAFINRGVINGAPAAASSLNPVTATLTKVRRCHLVKRDTLLEAPVMFANIS